MSLSRTFETMAKGKDLEKDKREMLGICEVVARMECDRLENEFGDYDGNLKVESNKIFDSRKKAEEYLNSLERYDDRAVLFRNYNPYELYECNNKKTIKLSKRTDEIFRKKTEYFEKNKLRNRKSKTIACPKCGSVLNIHYLTEGNDKIHKCPVCWHELFSKTVAERLAKLERDYWKLKEELDKEREKIARNENRGEVMWLIKIDVHC